MSNNQRLTLFSKQSILRLSVLFVAVLFAASGLKAQVISSEDFESQSLGTWTQISLAGDYTWEADDRDNNWYAEANGYGDPAGASDDWLISPMIDLTTVDAAEFMFRNASNFSGPALKLFISTNYAGDPTTATWNEYTDQVDWSTGGYEWVETKLNISAYSGQQIYIAFQYTTDGSGGGQGRLYRVDDLVVAPIQLPPPPTAGRVVNFEDFESRTLGTWMQYSVLGDERAWEHDDFQSTNYAEMNGFGEDDGVSEDWLISPELDLSDLGNVMFNFRNAKNFGGPDLELYISTNYSGMGDPNMATWENLSNQVTWSTGGYNFVNNSIDISFYADKKVRIAFKYTSTGSGGGQAALWQVDDLETVGTPASLIGKAEALTVFVTMPEYPIAGVPFYVSVFSVDRFGVPVPVQNDITFELNLTTGNFPLVGAGQMGTIKAGEYTASFGNAKWAQVTYPRAENIVIYPQVVGLNPENLALYEKTIMISQTVNLISNIYNKGHQNVTHPEFEVHALGADGMINPNFDEYEVTLEISNGNYTGTVTAMADRGVATFDDIVFEDITNYTVVASSNVLPNPSPNYNVSVIAQPTITGVAAPMYIKGAGQFIPGGTGRLPAWALVEFDNLHPNTEYRFLTYGKRTTEEMTESFLSGQNYLYDYMTNTYVIGENALSLREENSYSTMMTDGDGNIRMWVSLVPSSSSRFSQGNEVDWVVQLGSEFGGLLFQSVVGTSKAADFGTQLCDDDDYYDDDDYDYDDDEGSKVKENQKDATQAPGNCDYVTGIYEMSSPFTPGNFLALKNDNGDILSIAMVQDDDGMILQNPRGDGTWWDHQAQNYYRDVDGYRNEDGSFASLGTPGAWATIIPNGGNGIFSIEEWSRLNPQLLTQSEIGGLPAYTDNDGIWAGVETGSVSGSYFSPVDFETPQLTILAPTEGEDVCNLAPDEFDENRAEELYDILWNSYGVAELNVYYSLNGGPNEVLFFQTNGRDGMEDWDIFRERFDGNEVELFFESEEHSYLSASSGSFQVFDTPSILDDANSTVVCYDRDGAVSVNAVGTGLSYQWYKDGVMISGANDNIYELLDVDHNDAGTYHAEVTGHPSCPPVLSDPISVYIAKETDIWKQPVDQQVVEGGVARYEVIPHVNGVPDGYQIDIQWFEALEGTPDIPLQEDDKFEGTQSSIMTIRNVQSTDFGRRFYARVYGLCYITEVYDTDIVDLLELDFGWTSEPQDATACLGGDDAVTEITLTAEASTSLNETINYAWYRDGVKLTDGAKFTGTSTTELMINNLEAGDGGTYWCVATLSTSGNEITSGVANVTVTNVPTIVRTTGGGEVNEGELLLLTVEATGENLTYQWYLEGNPVDGATNSIYQVNEASEADGGAYYVIVSNDCDDVQSDAILVTIATGGDITSVTDGFSVDGFELGSVMPNPVSNDARFFVTAKATANAEIVISDITGRTIATVFNGTLTAGQNEISFNTNTFNLSSGTYYYTLRVERVQLTNKFNVIK